MPYTAKGKCVYKKDTGEKVGCTKGSVKKYLGALHANVPDAKNEIMDEAPVVESGSEPRLSYWNIVDLLGTEEVNRYTQSGNTKRMEFPKELLATLSRFFGKSEDQMHKDIEEHSRDILRYRAGTETLDNSKTNKLKETASDDDQKDCEHCSGQGWFPRGETDHPRQEQCPHCHGTGKSDSTDPKVTKLKEMIREIITEILNENKS